MDQAKLEIQPKAFVRVIREWTEAIVVAFLLAMFIRIFVVELFKIPSPSMTPTLLGTEAPRQAVSFYDVDEDGDKDLILESDGTLYIYRKNSKTFQFAGRVDRRTRETYLWTRKAETRQDRIIVGKFFYWFSKPHRGDIVVFKVPESIFELIKPIYIKRTVGLPGEKLTFEPTEGVPGYHSSLGWLVADDVRVTSPKFFQSQRYQYRNIPGVKPYLRPNEAVYRDHGGWSDLLEIRVPEDGIYVFGDNTVSSRDSRYWGKVPLNHLRGRAIFRYWNLGSIGFLH